MTNHTPPSPEPMHPDTAFALGCWAFFIVSVICYTIRAIFAHGH